MFQFPGFSLCNLWIQLQIYRDYRYGFSHSEIPGSKDACSSPRLIAACHVLHRLPVPRHPPYALSCLTILFCHELTHSLSALAFNNVCDTVSVVVWLDISKIFAPCLFKHVQCGGERIRTDDLLRARQLLSQLSYTPNTGFILVLGLSGIEPPTLRLSVVRSNHLSYRPNDNSCSFLLRPIAYRFDKQNDSLKTE